jgi:ATP-binding cassette subfamily B protein
VIQGQLTLGDLVALNLYIGLLAWPTMAIGWMLSLWHRGLASWHRLMEILQQRSALETGVAGAAPVELPEGGLGLELRELSVGFGGGGEQVLEQVSFSVPAGSLCAVVGRVGCGKTTLAEALARLLEVPPGTVFLGGRDVTGLPVEWVRAQVAYAPQSAFLFSVSIRDNIAMGLGAGLDPGSAAAGRAIQGAVKAAGLEPDLASFPDGLETMVGERGLSLSGGQRQRIALARALINERPVLILDDSLSSVDADTEKTILQQLRGVLRGRTAILISHRLSAIQHADQVLVLDGGRVAEAGTHDELLERGGLYAELYQRQVLAEEDGP